MSKNHMNPVEFFDEGFNHGYHFGIHFPPKPERSYNLHLGALTLAAIFRAINLDDCLSRPGSHTLLTKVMGKLNEARLSGTEVNMEVDLTELCVITRIPLDATIDDFGTENPTIIPVGKIIFAAVLSAIADSEVKNDKPIKGGIAKIINRSNKEQL
tara:strand:+ start:419 stop:886 length:468 start_codon:yes stop_codon:yes gene_type:complete